MKQTVDIRDVMRLSPATVSRVVSERTVLHFQTPSRREARAPEPEPVNVRAVDPLIMEAALRLTGGDASRINLRDDGSLVITNWARPGVDKRAQR